MDASWSCMWEIYHLGWRNTGRRLILECVSVLEIITQLCDLPHSIHFYVPFWGQIPKVESNNPLIFNELNEKASPAFARNQSFKRYTH